MNPPVPSRENAQALLLPAYGRMIALGGPPAALAAGDWLPSTYRIGTTPPEPRWAVREHSCEGWAAIVEDQVLTFCESTMEATEAAISDLELWVAEFVRKWVFVHTGSVAVDGQADVLPGP